MNLKDKLIREARCLLTGGHDYQRKDRKMGDIMSWEKGCKKCGKHVSRCGRFKSVYFEDTSDFSDNRT